MTINLSESGPTSPQANAASVNWSLSVKLISNITNDFNAVITTSTDHGFINGMYVLVNVSSVYGMMLNSVTSRIIVLSSTQFQTTIDTSKQIAFSPPGAGAQYTPAQVSAITGLFFNSTPGSPTGNIT